jgi:hypothetical protein
MYFIESKATSHFSTFGHFSLKYQSVVFMAALGSKFSVVNMFIISEDLFQMTTHCFGLCL